MHVQRVDADFSLWVDIGPRGMQEDISPFVGVRSDRVESAFQRWLGIPPDSYVGTFGANVGYVIDGKYRRYQPPASDVDVLSDIELGLARYRPLLSLDRLREAEAVAGIGDPGRSYRLFVIEALQGRLEAARRALAEAESEYCTRQDEVCAQFRGFARRARLEYPDL